MKILNINTKDKIEALTAEEFTVENIEAIVKEYYPHYTFVESKEEARGNYKEWGYLNNENDEYDETIAVYETSNAESMTVHCQDEEVEYQETVKIWVNEYYTDAGMVAEDYMYELHISID